LYEYAVLRVQEARESLARGDIAGRARAVSKTIAILGELETCLDHKRGGAIASNLARLYRYMRDRLTLANVKQADEPLEEVEALLATLSEAWQAIAGERAGAPADWGSLSAIEAPADWSAQAWSA